MQSERFLFGMSCEWSKELELDGELQSAVERWKEFKSQ
jgi:hypothetical protein